MPDSDFCWQPFAEVVSLAIETGLIDAEWLAHPLDHRPPFAPPMELLRRFVGRVVERHTSILGSIGLRAVELFAWNAFWERRDGLPAPQEQTRRAVIIFTDLEGFTAFTSEGGDERAREVLAEHLGNCTPLIRRAGGRVVKRLGDGLMIAFDSEAAALRTAVDLLDTAPAPLRVRVGVHAGEVRVLADDLIGDNVNIAARVGDLAAAGEVLASRVVIDTLHDTAGLTVGPPQIHHLKGVETMIAVSQVSRADE